MTSMLIFDGHPDVQIQEIAGQDRPTLDALLALNNSHATETSFLNPNFAWFSERLSRFVYVDRVIVDSGHRGQGLARQLYLDLFRRVREAGHATVVCEVNLDPPNPGSDAFHSKMGFAEMGRTRLPGGDKTVRYLMRYTS